MDGDDYPFNNAERMFEQTGWLKAEIERLRVDMVRETDLLKLEKRLEGFINKRDEQRTDRLMQELDKAFERGIPGTQQIVRTEMLEVRARLVEEFEAKLAKSGLVEKEDGTIAPKIHPLRKALIRNVGFVLFGIGVAAAANPEQALGFARLALTFIF